MIINEVQLDMLNENYSDEYGNIIEFCEEDIPKGCNVIFEGSNNKLVIGRDCHFNLSIINFKSNDCEVKIGSHFWGKITVDIGSGSKAIIGDYLSCQTMGICVRENGEVKIGRDCMFASSVLFLQSDTHPIFDVISKKRVNCSKNITVGNHVWLGNWATLLGGANVGNGSIIGTHSTVTGNIPNNVTAAGSPARVKRKNICWSKDILISGKKINCIDDCENKILPEYQKETEV